MTTLLRILRLYSLALWAGGEVFFVIVAGDRVYGVAGCAFGRDGGAQRAD